MDNSSDLEIANVIRMLRKELKDSMQDAVNEKLQFTASKIELELKIGIEVKGEGKGSLKFKVLSLFDAEVGAGGSVSDSRVQTIKLTLEPHLVDKDGGTSEVTVSSSKFKNTIEED